MGRTPNVMGQVNMELMQRMIDDHHAQLRAGNLPRIHHTVHRDPNRIRIWIGRMLIHLGERIRGGQAIATKRNAPRLALSK